MGQRLSWHGEGRWFVWRRGGREEEAAEEEWDREEPAGGGRAEEEGGPEGDLENLRQRDRMTGPPSQEARANDGNTSRGRGEEGEDGWPPPQ